ncbi:hypothetical protein LRP31_18785 [Mesorhizobium mediterraneum]|nr:hypothetical protein [Mesorhizobium mediterraneum]WIW51140.1 hypothetical protein LRP31_18785 [Mesorhizobium mediterraneum]
MAKIWAEIEADEQAKLEAMYATPKKANAAADTFNGQDFVTVETKGVRRIHGIASTPKPCTSGKGNKLSLNSRGVVAELPIPLLSQHDSGGPIGEVYHIRRTDRLVYVRASLFDTPAADFAWSLIQEKTVSAFSVLSADVPDTDWSAESVVDGFRFKDQWLCKEISLVREGANPDCLFEILRHGDDGKKFWDVTASKAEVNSSLPYAGVWKDAEQYQPGQFTTHDGSLWHAQIETKGVKPGTAPGCWKLAVKRGEAHKLENAK